MANMNGPQHGPERERRGTPSNGNRAFLWACHPTINSVLFVAFMIPVEHDSVFYERRRLTTYLLSASTTCFLHHHCLGGGGRGGQQQRYTTTIKIDLAPHSGLDTGELIPPEIKFD